MRFICGTQTQHTQLESRLSQFLGTEATILYSSCFDANGGVFEVLFGAEDAIVSDELNHASIIDGIRLSKAARFRYRNADMADLRGAARGGRAGGARRVCVVTDGVFSMDGSYAPLDEICDLADEFEAMVLVDDSHAVGFVGDGGRGTPELFGVIDRVDIVTGTLGKALGGASGGYVASHQEVVDLLRQRSRPYLFSNSVAPAVVAGSLAALDLVSGSERGAGDVARQRRPVPRADDGCGVRAAARLAPHHAGHVPRRRRCPPGGRRSPTTCSATASTSSRSASPWCPGAGRGSGCSCRRRTRRPTCGPASTRSWRRATRSARLRPRPTVPAGARSFAFPRSWCEGGSGRSVAQARAGQRDPFGRVQPHHRAQRSGRHPRRGGQRDDDHRGDGQGGRPHRRVRQQGPGPPALGSAGDRPGDRETCRQRRR